jgi:hypothetical protein
VVDILSIAIECLKDAGMFENIRKFFKGDLS